MLNVRITKRSFWKLEYEGYIIDESKDILTIRDKYIRPMVEIIYQKETNDLIIMTEDTWIYCLEVSSIEEYYRGIMLYYVNTKGIPRTLSIPTN